MKDIFRGWKEVRRILKEPDRTMWLFDFDGTLAPIARHPAHAEMPMSLRALLQKMARRFPGRVGILSGRSLGELKRKVGIPGLIYGGTHGFELDGPGLRWRHPLSLPRREKLRKLAAEIRRRLTAVPGAWLEDKRWTLCLHYREIPVKDLRSARSVRRICNLAQNQGFKLQKGLMAADILSYPRWNKGRAVQWLKPRRRVSHVFYAGDDATDETVFRVLRESDVSLRVGRKAPSAAKYRLTKQSDAKRLLQGILAL